jgi:hypothetical protein
MVHALREARRVLRDDGVMIDLRPIANDWPIEVVSARAATIVGRAGPSEEDQAADEAAQAAAAEGEAQGLFRRDREERFRFHYYWDSPAELQDFVNEEWADWIGIPEDVSASLRSKWAVADADARVRISLNMLITRWKKLT